jgi:hypothetical protein
MLTYFSLRHRVQTGAGVHSTSCPVSTGGGVLTRGVERSGRETDHSPPSSVKVKNAWKYTSTPLIRLHGMVLS